MIWRTKLAILTLIGVAFGIVYFMPDIGPAGGWIALILAVPAAYWVFSRGKRKAPPS